MQGSARSIISHLEVEGETARRGGRIAPFFRGALLQNSTASLLQCNHFCFLAILEMALEMGIFRTLARTSVPCAHVTGRMRSAIVSACTWPKLQWPGFSPRSWAAFWTARTVGSLAPKPTSGSIGFQKVPR